MRHRCKLLIMGIEVQYSILNTVTCIAARIANTNPYAYTYQPVLHW
jgi:hypothetical protein